uniref:Photosystem I subunit O n=1 Tax=Picea sitchensis TaxID=3332 RepID=A9NKV9_PICSI|nr:unknown [Picea sitchensis]ABK25280.1 unknown [Picea sitchensis]ABK25521.1 unknown [Picea sitchensis]ABK27000.1 unknown [Picea sitchensis]ABR18345.1 unknown [Picea sitchensis]
MATMAVAAANVTLSSPVAGLGTSSLSSSKPNAKLQLSSGFTGCTTVRGNNPLRQKGLWASRITCFQRNWLRTDYSVIGFGLIGWIAPSSLPVINGDSLTGLFFKSIGDELAHWPTGPSLTSSFWLWMICWHLGLFLCLTFGQIGFKGRSEYF